METLQSFARWAWETSLASSFLILLAVIAQRLLRKPAYTSARHLLGLLVLARLLLPHSFESAFSIFNWINPAPLHVARTTYAPSESFIVSSASESAFPSAPSAATRPAFNYFNMLPILWALGASALLARVAWQHLQVRRWIRASSEIQAGPLRESLDAAQALAGSHRKVLLHILPQISTAALTGMARPKILLSPALAAADAATLRLIFLHELAHIRRQDILINWAIILARALHWFNPLAWFALRRLNAEQELMCDAAVMRLLREEDRRNYGETLLSLASSALPSASPAPTLLPISAGYQQMKERIAMIRQFKPSNRVLAIALPPLAAVIILLTFTGASSKAPPTAPGESVAREKNGRLSGNEGAIRLKKEFEIVTLEIADKEEQMDKLRRNLGIAGPVPNEDALPVIEKVNDLKRERIRCEEESKELEMDYRRYSGESPQKRRKLFATDKRDERLMEYFQDLSKAEQQLSVLQKDYSDEYPEVVRTVAMVKTLDSQIEVRADALIAKMAVLTEENRAKAKRIEEAEKEARMQDAELRRASRPFFAIKRDIETLQKWRDVLYTRILQESAEVTGQN